jgi:hypothetical protein
MMYSQAESVPGLMGGGVPGLERVIIVYETLGEDEGDVRYSMGKAAGWPGI